MGKLVDGHRRARGAVGREELGVDLVVTAEVVHVDEERAEVDDVAQRGAGGVEDRCELLDDSASLDADVELRRAHGIDARAHYGVVRAPRRESGHEDEVARPAEVRVGASRRRELGKTVRGFAHAWPGEYSGRPVAGAVGVTP